MDTVPGLQGNDSSALLSEFSLNILRRILPRALRLFRNEVHEIMYVQNVSAGKNTGDAGLHALVDNGAVRNRVDFHPGGAGKLILRNQSNGEKKRITGIALLRSRNRLPVRTNLRDGDRRNMLLSLYVHHGMGKLQRDSEIVQTLDNVALQTTRIRHQLRNDLHLRAFQRHPPCHDQSDVTGSQNDNLASRHIALDVHQALCGSRRENSRGPISRNIQGASRSLPASHRKDDGSRLNLKNSFLPVHRGHHAVLRNVHDHRAQPVLDSEFPDLVNESSRVLRTRQLLLKSPEAEAVVDALIQNAAEFCIPLQNQNVLYALFSCRRSCRKTCGTSANDYNLFLHHTSPTSFVLSRTMLDFPPLFVISSSGSPSSLARMSITFGLQKPA